MQSDNTVEIFEKELERLYAIRLYLGTELEKMEEYYNETKMSLHKYRLKTEVETQLKETK